MTAPFKPVKDRPKRWGAYWLHEEGWYKLFPPTKAKRGGAK